MDVGVFTVDWGEILRERTDRRSTPSSRSILDAVARNIVPLHWVARGILVIQSVSGQWAMLFFGVARRVARTGNGRCSAKV
ncbi:hypothetical protein BS47DRAFT_1339803 [Hydnum rufescens UP504]|uniref:Uncharacterized protein n=1 Tax=Hydnum rufescens UP504 TaxID=1448309 RepID=A0A9P6B4S7_9AGAM|nr:hypothetical protein BS47DRAFT_1339803 [Hydnum rufescens UP504]